MCRLSLATASTLAHILLPPGALPLPGPPAMNDEPSPSGSGIVGDPAPQTTGGATARQDARRRRQERHAVRQMADLAPEVLVEATEPPERPGHPIREVLREWRAPLLVGVAVLLFAGTRFGATRPYEATFVALALPVLSVVMAALPLHDTHPRLRATAFALGALVLLGSELSLAHALFPPDPLDTVALTGEAPDADLAILSSQHRLEVETRATMGHFEGSAVGHFVLELSRDGAKRRLSGEFQRWTAGSHGSGRRAPQTGATHNSDVNRQAVDLPGSGMIHARLLSVNGAVAHTLHVSVFPALPVAGPLAIVLVLLALGAVGVEAIAARRGLHTHYASWIGMTVALALYLPAHFNPGDPFSAVLGSVVVATVAGGGGGLLLALGLTRLVSAI